MGLLVSIYRDIDGMDCTNGGVSSRDIKGLCITNIDGPFTPDPQYPAAKLVKHEYFHGNTVVIVPEEVEGRWTMMGGNLARSSDSRFSRAIEELLEVKTFYGGIPIHDRVEMFR